MPALNEVFERRDFLASTLLGRIYAGVHKRSQAAVAIKEFDSHRARLRQTAGGAPVVENAEVELAVLKAATRHPHPAVMAMHQDAMDLEAGDKFYAVMEYCDKGEALVWLQHHRLDVDMARAWFVSIVSGVQHLHKLGWYHRDISLENILLRVSPSTGELSPVVTDFGQAVQIPPSKLLTIAPGELLVSKPNYRAPEVIARQAYSGEAIDVYALGVVLFGLLTSALPYNRCHDAAYQRIQAGRLTDLLTTWHLTMPGTAVDLVTRMLAQNPAARPTLREVLTHPFCRTSVPMPIPLSDDDRCAATADAYTDSDGEDLNCSNDSANSAREQPEDTKTFGDSKANVDVAADSTQVSLDVPLEMDSTATEAGADADTQVVVHATTTDAPESTDKWDVKSDSSVDMPSIASSHSVSNPAGAA